MHSHYFQKYIAAAESEVVYLGFESSAFSPPNSYQIV